MVSSEYHLLYDILHGLKRYQFNSILKNKERSGGPPRFERDQSLLSDGPAEVPAEGRQKVLDAQPAQGGFSEESDQDSLGARV